MRVYIPGTVEALRSAIAAGAVQARSGLAFAVTEPLQAEYPGTDIEELEYLAMTDAARAALRLLGAGGPPIRVVIAADVPAATPYPEGDRAAVRLSDAVPWSEVASVHLDGADAADAVSAAVDAVDAADLGDLDAEFAVGEAVSHELAWYAPDEVRYLLDELG